MQEVITKAPQLPAPPAVVELPWLKLELPKAAPNRSRHVTHSTLKRPACATNECWTCPFNTGEGRCA